MPNCWQIRKKGRKSAYLSLIPRPTQSGVSYCPPDAAEATDTALKFHPLTLCVLTSLESAPHLEDAEIDFVTDQLGSQLIESANAKMRSKVADDAPLMERVEYALQSQINPQLAGHGRVSLMEITDEGWCNLQFGGGCNGCSMADVTLKVSDRETVAE